MSRTPEEAAAWAQRLLECSLEVTTKGMPYTVLTDASGELAREVIRLAERKPTAAELLPEGWRMEEMPFHHRLHAPSGEAVLSVYDDFKVIMDSQAWQRQDIPPRAMAALWLRVAELEEGR